jgi:hypothetical protein
VCVCVCVCERERERERERESSYMSFLNEITRQTHCIISAHSVRHRNRKRDKNGFIDILPRTPCLLSSFLPFRLLHLPPSCYLSLGKEIQVPRVSEAAETKAARGRIEVDQRRCSRSSEGSGRRPSGRRIYCLHNSKRRR